MLLQGLLLMGLVGQLMLDRARLPRGWAKSEPVDPDLPIRGRYVSLQLVVPAENLPAADSGVVRLQVRGDRLVATAAAAGQGQSQQARIRRQADGTVAVLRQTLAFFLPERVADPSSRPAGEELWVEVTLPGAGAPRPIRLGVWRDGRLEPIRN
jgi:hypothetical protein